MHTPIPSGSSSASHVHTCPGRKPEITMPPSSQRRRRARGSPQQHYVQCLGVVLGAVIALLCCSGGHAAGVTRDLSDASSTTRLSSPSQERGQRAPMPHDVTPRSVIVETVSGLTGTYFSNTALGLAPAHTGVDACINFGAASDAPGCPVGRMAVQQPYFSARWTGNLTAPAAGSYNFTALTDGGVRLWVDDHLLIDAWTPASKQPATSTHQVRC